MEEGCEWQRAHIYDNSMRFYRKEQTILFLTVAYIQVCNNHIFERQVPKLGPRRVQVSWPD